MRSNRLCSLHEDSLATMWPTFPSRLQLGSTGTWLYLASLSGWSHEAGTLVASGARPEVSLPTQWWCLPSVVGISEMIHLYMLANPNPLLPSWPHFYCHKGASQLSEILNGEINAKSRMRKGKVCSGSAHTATEYTSLNALHTQILRAGIYIGLECIYCEMNI